MDTAATTSSVTVKLGKSPLTDFIILFSDKMHLLDQICVDMTRIANEIDIKERELEAMYNTCTGEHHSRRGVPPYNIAAGQ